MANALYPYWRGSIMTELDANNSLDQTDANNACYVALVTIGAGAYVYSPSHQFYTSITNVQSTPQQLVNQALTINLFKADSLVFTNVTGTTIGALVIYRKNAGANSTWRLVLYEDTGIVGFPMVPNGGNLLLTWNASGIFAL